MFFRLQIDNQCTSVGRKPSARSRAGLFDRMGGRKIFLFDRKPRLLKTQANVITFTIRCRIDFVSDAVIALISVESDVMRAGSRPDGFTTSRGGSLPYPEMVPRCHHFDGIGLRVTEVLHSSEKL